MVCRREEALLGLGVGVWRIFKKKREKHLEIDI